MSTRFIHWFLLIQKLNLESNLDNRKTAWRLSVWSTCFEKSLPNLWGITEREIVLMLFSRKKSFFNVFTLWEMKQSSEKFVSFIEKISWFSLLVNIFTIGGCVAFLPVLTTSSLVTCWSDSMRWWSVLAFSDISHKGCKEELYRWESKLKLPCWLTLSKVHRWCFHMNDLVKVSKFRTI